MITCQQTRAYRPSLISFGCNLQAAEQMKVSPCISMPPPSLGRQATGFGYEHPVLSSLQRLTTLTLHTVKSSDFTIILARLTTVTALVAVLQGQGHPSKI